MRSRIGWIAFVVVIVAAVGGRGQCNCGFYEAPGCYRVFQSNQTIRFSLIAPLDYFICRGTSVSPSIWGWRAERPDGAAVRTVLCADGPVSRLASMEWDLCDDAGRPVPPGDYRLVVMSTDGDVFYPVRILEWCRPCSGCFCGGWSPPRCDVPCPIRYGELYLALSVGETRACSGLSLTIHLQLMCSTP